VRHGVLGEFFVFLAEFQRVPCSRILFVDLGSPLRKLCGMGNSIAMEECPAKCLWFFWL